MLVILIYSIVFLLNEMVLIHNSVETNFLKESEKLILKFSFSFYFASMGNPSIFQMDFFQSDDFYKKKHLKY